MSETFYLLRDEKVTYLYEVEAPCLEDAINNLKNWDCILYEEALEVVEEGNDTIRVRKSFDGQ